MSFGLIAFTNRGKALQAKAQAGAQLNFTRIAVGDGQLSGQAIADITDLVHEVKSISLNKFMVLPGGKAVVGGVLSNQDIITGFWWREVGVFAKDPDIGEILYCYGNAGELAEYIPSPGGSEILEKQVDIVSIIGNASNVSAEIDQSLVYETPAGAQAKAEAAAAAAVAAHEEDPDPHEQYALEADLADLQEEVNAHKANNVSHIAYGTALGTNDKTISLSPAPSAYVDGMALAFKNVTENTGAVTINVNGLGAKSVLKSNGSALASGNLKANSVYTIRYNGTNFILQGSDSTGNATPEQVLAGKTFSNDSNTGIIGTMPNIIGDAPALEISRSGTILKLRAKKGYYDGVNDNVTHTDPNDLPENIKQGVTIRGLTGTCVPLTNEKKWATGTLPDCTPTHATLPVSYTVNTLSFTPFVVLVFADNNRYSSSAKGFGFGGYIIKGNMSIDDRTDFFGIGAVAGSGYYFPKVVNISTNSFTVEFYGDTGAVPQPTTWSNIRWIAIG